MKTKEEKIKERLKEIRKEVKQIEKKQEKYEEAYIAYEDLEWDKWTLEQEAQDLGDKLGVLKLKKK